MRGSPCDSCRRSSTRLALLLLLTVVPVFAATASAQNVNYGTAYDAIDRTVVYVSTWFEDAKATSVRRGDGSIETIVEDGAANVLARAVHRSGSFDASLAGLGRLAHYSARLESSSSYATDWFNKQLYVLWRDQDEANRTPDLAGRALPLQWHRGHLRIKGQVAREKILGTPDPVDAKPKSVRTQFREHYAFSQRHDWTERQPGVAYASYSTYFHEVDGKQLGLMRYFDKPKVVTWSFAHGQEGVAPEWRLPDGYTFDPNMAWAGIQAMAFQRSRHADGRRVIEASNRNQGEPSRWARLKVGVGRAWSSALTLVAPVVRAQSTSCDGLSDGCTGIGWTTRCSWIAATTTIYASRLTAAAPAPSGPGYGRSGSGTASPAMRALSRASSRQRAVAAQGGLVAVGAVAAGGECDDNGAEWCPPQCMSCGEAY